MMLGSAIPETRQVDDLQPVQWTGFPPSKVGFRRRRLQSEEEDGLSNMVLVVMGLMFVMIAMGRICRGLDECQEGNGAAGDGNSGGEDNANNNSETMELAFLTGDKRKEVIEKHLPSEVAKNTGRSERSARSTQETGESESESGCAICIMDYCDGDKVCHSTNKDCPHKFHKECMSQWLQKDDECPICRQKYLPLLKNNSASKAAAAASSSSVTSTPRDFDERR